MTRRHDEEQGQKQLVRTAEAEREWYRNAALDSAKSWVGNVDLLIRRKSLDYAIVSVLNACMTIVLLDDKQNYWLVTRALESLKAEGIVFDEIANRNWLKRLRAYSPDKQHSHYSDSQSTWEEFNT